MLRIFVDCACYSTLDVLTLFKDTFISSLDYCSIFTHLCFYTWPPCLSTTEINESNLYSFEAGSQVAWASIKLLMWPSITIALNFWSSCFHQRLQNMLPSPDLYRNQINLGLPVIKAGYHWSTSPARNWIKSCHTEWEKIFAKHVSDKRLMSKMFKESKSVVKK